MTKQMERILPTVQKPARYVGGEYHQIVKNPAEVDVRVAFCFPDTYEIGMSNLGMRILYGVMNNLPNVWCERVFAPWGDMEQQMRDHGIPLWALKRRGKFSIIRNRRNDLQTGGINMLSNYRSKFVTPEVAAQAVQNGDWVDYGFGAGFPELMDKAIAARKGELKDVKVRGGLVIRPRIEVVECDPEQESFHYYSWHIGDYERKLQTRGLVRFMPIALRMMPDLYRHNDIRTDVVCIPVSKPDENGYFSLGITNFTWRVAMEHARTVIFEINEHYPVVMGVDGSNRVHASEATYIVEGEHEPLPTRSYKDPSPTDIAIAKLVVDVIPDGATLALGVGGVPFTVAKMLAESDKKDLGCHTGTISDAYLAMFKAGKLTNAKKEFDKGLSTWNLAIPRRCTTGSASIPTCSIPAIWTMSTVPSAWAS